MADPTTNLELARMYQESADDDRVMAELWLPVALETWPEWDEGDIDG